MQPFIEMNAGMMFLIVDQNSGNVEAMKLNLRKIGYRNALNQITGYETLHFIKQSRVDFVMCRLSLPDLTGVELLDELKNDLNLPRLPFLMFSEQMDQGDMALLLEKGVDAILTVPYASKQLAEKIMATWSKYIDPQNVEFHFEQGRRAFQSGELDKALGIFEKIEKTGKILERVMVAIGRVHSQKGDKAKALQKGLDARTRFPKSVHAFQFTGELYLETENYGEALVAFGEAIKLSPKNPFRYEIIAEILLNMKRWEEAKSVLEKAEKQGFPYKFVKEGIARSLLELDRKPDAIQYYQKLVEEHPKEVNYLNNIAVCYKKMEDYNRSLEYYNKALELTPDDPRILYNISLTYVAKGKDANAIKKLEELLLKHPEHEKAQQKLLQLKDPEAYKKFMAEKRSAPATEEPASELLSTANKHVKQIHVSASDQEKVQSLLQSLAEMDKRVTDSAPKLTLSAEEKEKIAKMGPTAIKYYYLFSLINHRKRFYRLMTLWFKSIIEISEETVSDMISICSSLLDQESIEPEKFKEFLQSNDPRQHEVFNSLKKAFDRDTELKDRFLPIITELQFQDYCRQIMNFMVKGYNITFQAKDASCWTEVEKILVSNDDRALFRKIVFGEEPAAKTNAPGDIFLF